MELSRFFTPRQTSAQLIQGFDEFGTPFIRRRMLTSDNWLETAPDSEPLASYTTYTSTSLANPSNRGQQAISDVDSDCNLPFHAQVAVPRMFGDSPTLSFARPNASGTLLTSLL
jgi:hypothetical protein